MSEAIICIKDPSETVKDFNKRLRDSCEQAPVTDFELHVVDGQPMVSMFAGMVEAEQEDVDDAQAEGEELELGALIPEDDPVLVQVCEVAALVPMERDDKGELVQGKEGDAAKSERKLDVLCERAGDAVTKIRVSCGTHYGWVQTQKETAKKEWLPISKSWIAIAHAVEAAAAPAKPAEIKDA